MTILNWITIGAIVCAFFIFLQILAQGRQAKSDYAVKKRKIQRKIRYCSENIEKVEGHIGELAIAIKERKRSIAELEEDIEAAEEKLAHWEAAENPTPASEQQEVEI